MVTSRDAVPVPGAQHIQGDVLGRRAVAPALDRDRDINHVLAGRHGPAQRLGCLGLRPAARADARMTHVS